jgi:hypothetical protein
VAYPNLIRNGREKIENIAFAGGDSNEEEREKFTADLTD